MHLVHVVEDLLFLFSHDAESYSIQAFLVHSALQINDLVCIKDGLRLGKLVVILRTEVLERLPVLLAERLMFKVQVHLLKLLIDLCKRSTFCLVSISGLVNDFLVIEPEHWQLHLEPSHVRFLGQGRCLMILGHLNHKELLL